MPVGMIIWLVVVSLVGVTWSLRHFAISRARRTNRRLAPDSHPKFAADAPRLSVIVAAKDEEKNIGTCVHSLLDQDYPNYEVVAVNDRSDDATGEILDTLQREHPDLVRALHVKHLPDGWFGKNNAMRLGVSAATGEWFCFIDADCRQISRSTLTVAMREAQSAGADFLSVLPVLETLSFWERVIQPVCTAILVIWFNPEKVNNPKSKAAYANGAFMLMSREHYNAIGGHDAVRTELNEDMHMARITKEVGRRLLVVESDGLYLTRMYASFGEAWRGWSRIFYGVFKTFRRLLATLALVLFASVFPWVSFVIALIGYAVANEASARDWGIALVLTSAVVVILESVIYRFMSLMRAAPWAWMTYPVGAVLGVGMILAAMRKLVGGRTTWRGTTYRGESHDTSADDSTEQITPQVDEPAVDVA
ncbi:MAG: glycosyltransferase [Phycisphaerales bacterium]|nr:glycosyltransferase [Phycisphaerales bacterium]